MKNWKLKHIEKPCVIKFIIFNHTYYFRMSEVEKKVQKCFINVDEWGTEEFRPSLTCNTLEIIHNIMAKKLRVDIYC